MESTKKFKKPRCFKCNKKIKIMAFDCRCGNKYCSRHRLPEDHMCSFDYELLGKKIIKEKNPIITNDKLLKI
jgi:predicted nucleic acid binding AN1-type Zn finger protein